MGLHLSVVGGACALAAACAAVSAPWAARADAQETAPGTPAEGDRSAPAPAAPPPAGATAPDAAGAGPDASPPVVLPEVVVRLPRRETTADPTSSATLVPAQRYAGEAKQVAELVATAPGVAVHDAGGLGQLATVSIRGSTADDVLVLLDGLPLNTAAGGGVDLSSIPRGWISRIEVVRGAEGARYGAGALGGVVNVITRAPDPGRWSVTAGGGSFETFTSAADGSARAGPWSLVGTASADATGGRFPYVYVSPVDPTAPPEARTRENDAAWRGGALVRGTRALGDGRLELLGQLSGGRRELPGLPQAPSATGEPPPPPPRSWTSDGRALLMARVSAPGPLEGLHLAGRATLRLDRLDTFLDGVDPDVERQRGGAAGLALEARHLGAGRILRAGAELEGERLDASGLGPARTRATGAGWASATLRFGRGRGRLSPALRAERVGPFSGWSGSLGASWDVAGPVAIRASAGRTFRAPSFSELYLSQGLFAPNPGLRPEEGLAADAALVAEGAAGRVAATAYATLYRDLIVYQPASGGRYAPFNAGKSLVRGVELEAATRRWPALLGLSAEASYTLLASEILRGDAATLGHELPRKARDRLYARASVAPGPLEAHADVQAVGRMWANPQNTEPVPATLVWNAGASLRIARAPAVRLFLEVKNVGDDRRLLDPWLYPLPGRMVMLTVRAGDTDTEGE